MKTKNKISLYSSYVELDKTLKVVAFLEIPPVKTDLFTE